MNEVDLEGLMQKDRMAWLPEAPELGRTLAAVRARACSETRRATGAHRPAWGLILPACAVTACTLVLLLAGGTTPLLLVVPALQLTVLQLLIEREVEKA